MQTHLSVGELTMGRIVYGAKRPWGESSMGRINHGANRPASGQKSMGRIVQWTKHLDTVMDIGLKSERCVGTATLGTGRIDAVFH